MVDAMRAMLDELMGKERNVPLGQRSNRKLQYDDPSVCKLTLAGLCPNRLFKNTRSDLGPCGYELHDDHIEWEGIKAEYDRQDAREHERYERRLMKVLEELIRDLDRKIARAKERAEAESTSKPLKPDDAARLAEMQARAKDLLRQSQEAGEMGDVDISMALAQQAQDVQGQHDRLHRSLTAPDRTLQVCEVCGIFTSSTDNEQTRLEHLTGKQYTGWKAIRDKYAELTAKWEGPGAGGRARSREPEPDRREYDRERSAGVDERERRDRERDRSPSRHEYGKGRDSYSRREYDRGGAREYDRSRSYDSGRDYDSRGGREYDRGGYDDRRAGGSRGRDSGRPYDSYGRYEERRQERRR